MTGAAEPCAVVGVDVGGTFIDYVAIDGDGRLRTHKHLSDPSNLADAFLDGLRVAAPAGTRRLVHGTTVATNALLERRGAATGLLTTAGFADVLAIGRQNRPRLYALDGDRPPPLVPRELRLEAAERVSADGEVLSALDEASVRAAATRLAEAGVEAVAVSFLFSFLRPDHERRAGELLREALGDAVFVYLSSEVLPEFREYERVSTTVATAYVGPVLDRYVEQAALRIDAEFQVMQSNGGVVDAAEAARHGAALVLSGPAAGVVGGFETAASAGFTNVLTFDMGGTSTDVALCPGEIRTTVEGCVGDVPIRLPMIDIHTVGAGGGSIARVDAGGLLRVGPESAGADPGPACYGHGELPTVTDADVVLGRIPLDSFLGGRLALDAARAEAAMARLGDALGLAREEAALGVVRVAQASMQRAIRRVSVERGYDPRGFTLVAFGGAGPLHAAELATELEIRRVLVPRHPGVASALGMAAADEIRDFSRTVKLELGRLDGDLWRPLEQQAATHGDATWTRSADLRYVGQSFEIEVPADDVGRLRDAFERAHERLYGFAEPGRPVEVVNVRLRARRPRAVAIAGNGTAPGGGAERIMRIRFVAGAADTLRLDRSTLAPGQRIEGPALVAQPDAATLVPPGWVAQVDRFANLVLEVDR